jgi:hypothetical protein
LRAAALDPAKGGQVLVLRRRGVSSDVAGEAFGCQAFVPRDNEDEQR